MSSPLRETLKDFAVELGESPGGGEAPYLLATVVLPSGASYRGPVACFGRWELIAPARGHVFALDGNALRRLAEGVADVLNRHQPCAVNGR